MELLILVTCVPCAVLVTQKKGKKEFKIPQILINNNNNMSQIMLRVEEPEDGSWREPTLNEEKNFILSQLATKFSDDLDFLRKINKLTFGLQSK